uniref:Replicase n=1 Tax=Raspberry vein chlorosis virus TaxID=758677 RepID=A0A482PGV3_9RHAB|nr:replicase [Raspberry vein chlorosis virus]
MDYVNHNTGEGGNVRKEDSLPDFHMRNPITQLEWLHDKTKLTSRNKFDLGVINSIGKHKVKVGSHIDLYLDREMDMTTVPLSPLLESLADVSLRLSIDLDILGKNRSFDTDGVITAMLKTDIVYWNGMRFWGHILRIMNALSSNRKPPTGVVVVNGTGRVNAGRYTIIIMKTSIMITGDNIEYLLYDGDWVRLTSDVYTQRFLFLAGANAGSIINSHQYPSVDTINSVIAWGDKVLRDMGNTGFKVIKTYEALVIGVIQTRGKGDIIEPDRFLKNTLQDLFDDSIELHKRAEEIVSILMNIGNLHHLTQLYGMHRIWGHPMVEPLKGMQRVITIGRKEIIKDSSLAADAGRMFKLLFCKEYKAKNGHYPPVIPGPELLITELSEGDQKATSKNGHPLKSWDRVKFRQLFQLPETFNLSMIVADKSISPTRSELRTLIRTKRTVMSPDKRRGVKRWLEDTTLNPREFLDSVNEGMFPDDHKVIGLTPKERELNPTPRMFALMSHLLRVYVVLTEQLISDHVLRYFPQITMTDTLLDLTKKMYSTVKHQSIQNRKRGKDNLWASRVVCMSLDFEKWNGHMRKEMTSGVFTALGDLFGLTEIYNVTYDIFKDCYYYLADGSYVPTCTDDHVGLSIDEPKSFIHHKGGMEGLRQKGWTLFTVCALEVVLSRHDCSYKIMGMGDNQVLQITLYTNKVTDSGAPSEEGLTEMKNNMALIFKELVSTFTDAGLPLKPLETWMSEDLYVYGKIPVWKGVPLPMDLKKIMRMFPFSNADVMTLENALSTISGNALSSTQATSCIWTPYVMCVMMHSLCIHDFLEYHPLLGEGLSNSVDGEGTWTLRTSEGESFSFELPKQKGLTNRHLNMLMQIIPRVLTGYNGINILEMMMRGFPDNLSRDVSYLTAVKLSDKTPSWLRELITNWIYPIYMPQINYANLVTDVTAVNLISPRSTSSGIKQVVTKYLSSGKDIRNEEFRNLMQTKQKKHEEFMAELICCGPELHIKLIHDLIDATIYGYVDSILSKVVKTNTIQKLAMQHSEDDIFKTIYRDEKTYYKFFKWRSCTRGEVPSSLCPTDICREMRLIGWQKELRGITIPHPFSYMEETSCDHRKGCDCIDGYMSIHLPDGQLPDDMWMNSIGANPPYLGSMTKEKVIVGAGGKVYSGEPLIKRPLNLMRSINWFVPEDSVTAEMIKRLVSSVSDIDPEPYVGQSEGVAGAELHRYKDSSTSHGALTSSSYLLSTRYHISSDHFHRYCRGSENTDLHFQALYCFLVEMTNLEITRCLQTSALIPRLKHYRQRCDRCIKPVKEDFVDIANDRILTAIPSRKSNIYLYVKSDKIRILEDRSPLSRISPKELSSDLYFTMSGYRKRLWLQDIVADKIVAAMIGIGDGENTMDTGVLTNPSFERTMYLKIDPKYVIDAVMGGLSMCAEWRWLESTGHHKMCTPGELARNMITIIQSADISGLMGLGMFFCWEESSRSLLLTYPEMVPPNTNPMTFDSCCSALKTSLVSLSLKKRWTASCRFYGLADDEKSSLMVVKKMLYQKYGVESKCISCKRLISKLQKHDIQRLRFLICKSGHSTFGALNDIPWASSYVTIERLRKDCDSYTREGRTDGIANAVYQRNCPIDVIELLRDSDVVSRGEQEAYVRIDYLNPFPVKHHEFTLYHLYTLDTLPTRTKSKYMSILGPLRKHIIGKSVFLLGDGLGSTSALLSNIGAAHVVTSTLLDPGRAIPQTYVHNVTPNIVASCNPSLIDSSTMIDKINDVLDTRWSESWEGSVQDCDICISDIELFKREDNESRRTLLTSVLCLKSWKMCILKDYIYSASDLSNSMKIISSSLPRRWVLVTTPLRSASYPECWWVIHESRKISDTMVLGVDPSKLQRHWNKILETLTAYPEPEDVSDAVKKYLLSFMDESDSAKMLSYLRSWMTIPSLGLVYPDKGTFTRVYYYLKKNKQPAYAKLQRSERRLKLYDKDYYRLRDLLLALALSMCSVDQMVVMEMARSDMWYLEWEEKEIGHWDCVLIRSLEPEGPTAKIEDYLPVLRVLMEKDGLSFSNIPDTIRFSWLSRAERDKDYVHFPISRTASMRSHVLIKDKRS